MLTAFLSVLKPCKCYNRNKAKCNEIPQIWTAIVRDLHLQALQIMSPLPLSGPA